LGVETSFLLLSFVIQEQFFEFLLISAFSQIFGLLLYFYQGENALFSHVAPTDPSGETKTVKTTLLH